MNVEQRTTNTEHRTNVECRTGVNVGVLYFRPDDRVRSALTTLVEKMSSAANLDDQVNIPSFSSVTPFPFRLFFHHLSFPSFSCLTKWRDRTRGACSKRPSARIYVLSSLILHNDGLPLFLARRTSSTASCSPKTARGSSTSTTASTRATAFPPAAAVSTRMPSTPFTPRAWESPPIRCAAPSLGF